MDNKNFVFLKDEFNDIYNTCNNVDELICEGKYENALTDARKAIELIVKTIFLKENMKYPSNKKLSTAIQLLSRRKTLEPPIIRQCNEVKDIGNDFIHPEANFKSKKKYDESPQELSFSVHHKLYNVASDFYLEFSDAIDKNDVGRYQGVILNQNNDSKILESIEKLQRSIDSNNNQSSESNAQNGDDNSQNLEKKEGDSKDANEYAESWLDDYEFNDINGSYLLGELNKLNDSSREAVEGSESLSDFKQYLHVKRTIEDELLAKLNEANNSKCKLVMLCGSVGDGKSHLIARFNDEYPELMQNFKIVKDATESDSFDKTSIETLVDKLSSFDDDHIESSNEKLILLINLGVLNNFMYSDLVQQKYSHLLRVLDNLSIFDSDDFSNRLDDDFISVISFSDYYLFEFDDNHPDKVKSQFISELFSKITDDSKDNPFYKAYQMDKENSINNPIIKNYEFFRMPIVQRMIIFNIRKIIIKYKLFISTRELLNFIYEILVPADIKNYEDFDSPVNYMEYLLPNLLFGSDDRCDVLKAINYEDPVLKRVEVIDKLLIDLNTGMNLEDLFEKYMDVEDLSFFEDIFDFGVVFTDYKEYDKQIISTSILRFTNIFGKDSVRQVFNKQSYLDYIDYLYRYNRGEQKYLKNLILDIKNAIFNWKGKLSDDYICIENLDKFKLGKSLAMEFKGISGLQTNDLNRFKTSMLLPFYKDGGDGSSVNLNVDYSLYEVITKLVKGYKPNNSEQKDLILFNEFIDNLIAANSSNKCLICNHNEKICFKLEYNETFEEYVFKRV